MVESLHINIVCRIADTISLLPHTTNVLDGTPVPFLEVDPVSSLSSIIGFHAVVLYQCNLFFYGLFCFFVIFMFYMVSIHCIFDNALVWLLGHASTL